MIRCPRCFGRAASLDIHVCTPMVPVRRTPTPVRVVEDANPRKPGRPRRDPTATPRVKGPRGGARASAGRQPDFDDATLRRAVELRRAGQRWAEVGAAIGVDNGYRLRNAIQHRLSRDPQAFARTENDGGARAVFTADELGAAQRMREFGMPWAQVASNLSVADVGQLCHALSYQRRRPA